MKVKVYRIDRSLLGKVGRALKTPDLPVQSLAGGYIGGFIFDKIARTAKDVMEDNVYILNDDEEINRFYDPRGLSLQDNVYYVRNPSEVYTRELIPAPEFHPFVLRQQTAEIIDFVRANLSVTKILLEIVQGTNASLDTDILLPQGSSAVPFELSGQAKYRKVSKHMTEISFEHPLKPSEKRKKFGWIDSFPQLSAAIDNVSGCGSISVKESYDLSFGVNLKLASRFGIAGEWLTEHHWNLNVSVA